MVAPEFAGIDLGVAEKMAVRAIGTAIGRPAEDVAAVSRQTGDLGQAAEQLVAETATDRPPTLQVKEVSRDAAGDRRGGGHRLAGPQARPARRR